MMSRGIFHLLFIGFQQIFSSRIFSFQFAVNPLILYSNMSEYETVICVKNEMFVYNIPPRQSNRGYRAADWKLDKPDYILRMRVVSKGSQVAIKLEDKTNGELFAQCPVDAYPGVAVEPVMDSSRYFVLRIMDESGRTAFIGAGFQDRADSFDLNVALQDHFRYVNKEKEMEVAAAHPQDTGPKLDLGFKAGQTIKLNIASKKTDGAKSKSRPQVSLGSSGLLPPPPPSGKIIQPPAANIQPSTQPFMALPASQEFGASAVSQGFTPQTTTQTSQSDAPSNWVTFD